MSLSPLRAAAALLALMSPAVVQAQMMPGGGFGAPGMAPGMQPPPPGGGQQHKEEGPAEEAPEETRPSDLEPLGGYAEQDRRKMQLFELSGSLRLRTDYMHQFFLGQGYTMVPSNIVVPGGTGGNFGLPPFPVPLDCPVPPSTTAGPANSLGNCSTKNIGGANLRFRLNPTLNVSDQVRVLGQIDVFDNTIMGSTPDSLAGIEGFNRSTVMPDVPPTTTSPPPPGNAPVPVFSHTQYPPEVNQNGWVSSIRAKRAWAEIDSEFGSIRFGRMPWHWGRGMFYNDGNCIDCDVGTTVDRVMGLTTVYGHQLALAWDLGAQGLTTQQLTLGRNDTSGYPYDLSQNDDVMQLVAAITRIDAPIRLRERVDAGDIVVNYGLQFVYRNQGKITFANSAEVMTGNTNDPARLQNFDALTFTPDVWLKLHYKALTVEFEGIGIIGRIKSPGILVTDALRSQTLNLRQVGWVLASELRLYRDSFFIGLETGGATGDQAEEPGQYLNYRWRFVQQRDRNLNDFHFSPSYHVDQIFFRHIMGTVTNAIYVKPQTSYWFDLGQTRALGLTGSLIYSMAQVPVSTPGNSLSYGVEMDLGAGYRNTAEGFYGGFTWGVFFPLGALDRPVDLWGSTNAQVHDASIAQILRIYMGVKF